MLPASLGWPDAVARYGVGSLANTLLPGRAGDAVRIGLFGRVVPGGALTVAGAVAAAGTARWLALTPLGTAGALDASVPPVALLAAGAVFLPLPLAWVLARRGSERARRVLAPLRYARAADFRRLGAWVVGIVCARVLAAAAVAEAFAVPHPVATAALVVPALELAGIVPLTPANLGIAGGAAALIFHTAGAPTATALTAGLTLHAIETVTALAVGAASALSLARANRSTAWRPIAQMLRRSTRAVTIR